jgi:hypothetical protein
MRSPPDPTRTANRTCLHPNDPGLCPNHDSPIIESDAFLSLALRRKTFDRDLMDEGNDDPMKKRVILLLILILTAVLPTSAQESGCDINLEQAINLLFQAQRDADGGDTLSAVQTIEAVQADLQALIDACSGVSVPLPRSFVAPDQSLSFNYPDSWTLRSIDTGVYYMVTSTPAVADLIANESGVIPEGEQALVLAVVDVSDGYGSQAPTSFEEIVDAMHQDFNDANEQVSGPVPMEINGRQARRFRIENPIASAILDAVDYMSEDELSVVLIAGFAAPGETAALEPLLEAFEASVSLPAVMTLRQPGVPLEDLRYVSAVAITDLSEDIDPRRMALAPNGSAIAWYERADDGAICLFALADQTSTCAPVPETFGDVPLLLYWSPDSAYIAFTGNFFQTFRESDIHLYDVAQGLIFDRTDDGVDEGWSPFGGSDSGDPVWADAVFTWGPDGDIYFIRDTFPSGTMDTDTAQTGLYRIAPDGGEAALLRDLTGMFEPFPFAPTEAFSLDGVMSVSSDAQQIAFLVRENELDSPHNGVWAMDLAGEAPPHQLIDNSLLLIGIPEDREQYAVIPSALTWDADGTGIYLLADTFYTEPPYYALAYHIDVETSQITLLTDVTGLTEEELTTLDPDTGRSPQFQMARGAVLAPDGHGLLVLNQDPINRVTGISSLRVVDGVVESELLYLVEDATPQPAVSATVASDGTALMWGYLFTPEH